MGINLQMNFFLEMILCSVDDWLQLDWLDQYEITQFSTVVMENPLEEIPILVAGVFGMGPVDSFKNLKIGIATTCGIDSSSFRLFWNGRELMDQDTPDSVGMEALVWKTEVLEIHRVSNMFET